MAIDVYKVLFEDNNKNAYWFHTSADITFFDGTQTTLLTDTGSVNDAIIKMDSILSNRVSMDTYYATIGTTFEGTEAPYTQTINVDGITANDDPFVGLIVDTNDPANGKNQEKSFGYISRITTGSNYIKVYCNNKKPEVKLNIKLVVFRAP